MRLLGITGGIGCGKSSVCKILQRLNCELFNADNEARTIQETDSDVIQAIKDMFGNDIYTKQSEREILDRKKVSAIVFHDKTKLQALNHIVHPKVREVFQRKYQQAIQSNKKAMAYEAAILFEAASYYQLLATVVVTAEIEIRMKRLKALGWSEKDIVARIANQMSEKEMMSRATYIIPNNSTEAELEQDVQNVFNRFCNEYVSI